MKAADSGLYRIPRLYGRRNDSTSLNRSSDDTLLLGRAHSLGWRRQQVELLGWALMVNPIRFAFRLSSAA